MRKFLTMIMTLLFSFTALVACGGGNSSSDTGSEVSSATSNNETSSETTGKVSLLLSSTEKEMYIDEEYTISYVVRNSEEKAVFVSSNPEVAMVDENGKVKALSVGEAMITVSVGNCLETCAVTVKLAPTYRIWVSNTDILLVKNSTFAMEAAVKKGTTLISDVEIAYRSTDESIFTVDEIGQLTAKKVGSAQLELSCAYDNKQLSEFVNVSVSEAALFNVEKSVTIDWQKTHTLEYFLTDFNGQKIDDAVAEIVSADTNVVSVSGNVLTASGIGDTSVTLAYAGCKVQVQVHCLYQPLELEFNAFRHEKIFKQIRSHQYYYQTDATKAYGTFSLTTETIGGNSEAKAKLLPLRPNGKTEKYLGIFVPCLQSKEALVQLQLDGYVDVTFQIYFDYETAPSFNEQGESNEGYITAHIKSDYAARKDGYIGDSVDLSKVHAEKNNQQWLTCSIPIQSIVKNYDDLATGNKPLFKILANSDEINYTMYMTPLTFKKLS